MDLMEDLYKHWKNIMITEINYHGYEDEPFAPEEGDWQVRYYNGPYIVKNVKYRGCPLTFEVDNDLWWEVVGKIAEKLSSRLKEYYGAELYVLGRSGGWWGFDYNELAIGIDNEKSDEAFREAWDMVLEDAGNKIEEILERNIVRLIRHDTTMWDIATAVASDYYVGVNDENRLEVYKCLRNPYGASDELLGATIASVEWNYIENDRELFRVADAAIEMIETILETDKEFWKRASEDIGIYEETANLVDDILNGLIFNIRKGYYKKKVLERIQRRSGPKVQRR